MTELEHKPEEEYWWNQPLEREDFDSLGDMLSEVVGLSMLFESTGVREFGELAEELAREFNTMYEEMTGVPFIPWSDFSDEE